MKPRIRHLAYTFAAVVLLFMGWQAHRTYLYVQAVHEKARTCDEIDCLAVKDAAAVMVANDLPVTRGMK
jgi:hypothetical protein